MKVQLPAFLMTHEDYMQMEMPPVKNFIINQKDIAMKEVHFADSEQVQARESEVYEVRKRRRSFCIVVIIVFLLAVLGVGIYFALTISIPK